MLDGQRYGHGDIDGFLCAVPYQKWYLRRDRFLHHLTSPESNKGVNGRLWYTIGPVGSNDLMMLHVTPN